MELIQIVGIALTGALLALWLKPIYPEYSVYIVLGTGVLLLFSCFGGLRDLMQMVTEMEQQLGEDAVYIKILCKLVGIAYISEFASNICKDAGFQSLAGQMEMAGKLVIIVCAVPILQGLLETINQLLKNGTI